MTYVIGVDEAGRGPLAGPVAVGLVRAPEDLDLLALFPGLNDSKKLSEKKRELLFQLLEEQSAQGDIAYTVVLKDASEIDERGIAVVIREAIAEGLAQLISETNNAKVWLDGSLAAPVMYEQETVIGGDGLVPAIMLASIAAKVTRDRRMIAFDAEYPVYEFARHKGYGTKAHMCALRAHGLSVIHRSTFIHLDRTQGEE